VLIINYELFLWSWFSIAMIAAVFNFGPQHPSTHGVLRLISLLHGELIQ